MKPFPDNEMIGHIFGRLTVLSYAYSKLGKYYLCRCVCGKEKTIKGNYIRKGTTRSCGCLNKRIAISEGF